jgi:enoyl-CoA hydratase
VAELRLDNPAKLNAFTVEMLAQLAGHLDTIERSGDVACVLVTAAEAKAFCAGADINGWGDLTPAEFARHWVRGGHRIFDRLARLAQPTIAVLQAHAFGGGLELAAACDIRVMAPKGHARAARGGQVGIVPGWSGSQRLRGCCRSRWSRRWRCSGGGSRRSGRYAMGFAAEVAEDAAGAARPLRARADLSPRAVEIAKSMIHAGGARTAPPWSRRWAARPFPPAPTGPRAWPPSAPSARRGFRGHDHDRDDLIPASGDADLPEVRVNRHLIGGRGWTGRRCPTACRPRMAWWSAGRRWAQRPRQAAIAAARAAFDDGRWSRLPAKGARRRAACGWPT